MDEAPEYTIYLSGPAAQRGVAVKTLRSARIPVDEAARDHHGLPALPKTDAWICSRHRDVDLVVSVVESLGWHLRKHQAAPTAPCTPSRLEVVEAQLAEIQLQLAELRASKEAS